MRTSEQVSKLKASARCSAARNERTDGGVVNGVDACELASKAS